MDGIALKTFKVANGAKRATVYKEGDAVSFPDNQFLDFVACGLVEEKKASKAKPANPGE